MHQTEVQGEEVRSWSISQISSQFTSIWRELQLMSISKVLPADYVFIGLSVATDIIGTLHIALHTNYILHSHFVPTGGATVGLLWGLLTAVFLF